MGRSDVSGVGVQGQPILACFDRGGLRVTGLGEGDDPGVLGDRIASAQRGEPDALDSSEHRRVLIKHGADGRVPRTVDGNSVECVVGHDGYDDIPVRSASAKVSLAARIPVRSASVRIGTAVRTASSFIAAVTSCASASVRGSIGLTIV